MKKLLLSIVILFNVINVSQVKAQYIDDKPVRGEYYTTETEHFTLIFPLSMKRVVNNHVQMLESSYDSLTALLEYEPSSKTTLIVKDEDISNGWAAASINNFSIWPTASEYLLRGTHDWKHDVISHEFSHILTIAPSYRFKPFIPDARLGYVSGLTEQNVFAVASAIVPFSNNPMWFLEGIAQYSSFRLEADKYDSHRKMILRSDAHYDKLHTLNELRVFSKDALGSERVYNHGFSLTKYIVDKYSLETVVDIIRTTGKLFSTGFYSAFEDKTGDKLEDVYQDWADSLKVESKEVNDRIQNIKGEQVFNTGFYNVFPKIKDGRIWFKSTLTSDYGPMSYVSIPIEFNDTTKLAMNQKDSVKMFKMGVNYSYSLSSDSSYYLFSKMKEDGSRKKQLHIAYKKEIKDGKIIFDKEKELKKLKRVVYTAIHPTNDSIFAFVMARPSYNIIGVADIKGNIISKTDTIRTLNSSNDTTYTTRFENKITKRDVITIDTLLNDTVVTAIFDTTKIEIEDENINTTVTEFKDRGVMFGVNWKDSTNIVFSYFQSESRDLGIYNFKTNRAEAILDLNSSHDERDVIYYNDKIIYSSDKDGIFNIYSYDTKTKTHSKITDVLTGAFMPSVNDSLLAYSMFGKDGYEIRLLKDWDNDSTIILEDNSNYLLTPKQYTISSPLKIGEISKYSIKPSNYLLSPMIYSDKYGYSRTLKVGASAYFFDPLMKFNIGLFGSYDVLKIGTDGSEFDVGVITELKVLPWTVSLEYFYSTIDSRVNYRSEYDGEIEQDSVMYRSMQFGFNNRYQLKGKMAPYKIHLFGAYNTSGATHYDNPYFKLDYNFFNGINGGLMISKFSYVPSKEFGINPIGTFAKLKIAYNMDRMINQNLEAYEVFYVTPNGILKTRDSSFTYPTIKLDYRKYFKMPGASFLTGGINTNINMAFMNDADSLFHTPNSGFTGISAYPLKQDSTTWGYSGMYNFYFRGDLRFPIHSHVDKSLGFIYFDRIYGAVFGEYAYSESSTEDIKFDRFTKGLKGVGASVRLETIFGSSYPWYLEVGSSFPIESTPQMKKYVINIRASMSLDRLESIESPFY